MARPSGDAPCARGAAASSCRALDVHFRGLSSPLRLRDAESLLPVLADIAPGWPHGVRRAEAGARPFFTITAEGGQFLCETHVEDRPARRLDGVNAICDAVAGLAMAVPAEDDRLLCLHAAGVVMAEQVVIFPNVRRAGKSTLSAALARAGRRVFSDDVLPVSFPVEGGALARSMGIAPRLRLPVPEMLPPGFRSWVAAMAGPENRQYRYLRLPDPSPEGESLPVGAFVILDRQDMATPARLEAVPPDQAMDVLLHQNFTRDRHSGDVLTAMARTLDLVPVFRLAYAGLDEAVNCLQGALGDRMPPAVAQGPALRFRMAAFHVPGPARATGAALCQRPGTVAREIGERLYLADPEGRAIHRMDALATAIWDVLETPTTPEEIAALLAGAFPGIDAGRLRADAGQLLAGLARAGLIA